MGKVWVRAKTVLRYEEQGRRVTKMPGEWAEVGKHLARSWLDHGQAEIPKPDTRAEVQSYDRCGVRVRVPIGPNDARSPVDTSTFGDLADELAFTYGEPAVPYDYTVIWKPPSPVVEQAVRVGLTRLHSFEDTDAEPWEMLAMLASELRWAESFGSEEERAKTEETIGDLRLPVYDTDLLFVRRTKGTEAVVARWADELREGADERHAFLRALYAERVLMCTLGTDWQGKHREWE